MIQNSIFEIRPASVSVGERLVESKQLHGFAFIIRRCLGNFFLRLDLKKEKKLPNHLVPKVL